MERVLQVDGWSFEVVQVRARRTCEHGKPFDATCTINIIDGVAVIEGLLVTNEWTLTDSKTFRKYAKVLRLDRFKYFRK